MSPPLNYFPAYLGLFAAQTLALVCNAFLDIQYGGFAIEVLVWATAFAITLWVGWRQGGKITDSGKRWMLRFLIFGALISTVLFIPMWGFPRAGLYMLAMLQVAYNCVTTTRRHLHLGLLVSVVMVLFAASHYRADWTMLFYLIPYVVAVVFTLVAEQINRKASELRQQSLGHQVVGAQGAAIAAATAVILALGLLFYALTPQVNWPSLTWRWGQPSGVSIGNGNAQLGNGGMQSGGSSGAGSEGKGGGGSGAGGDGEGGSGSGTGGEGKGGGSGEGDGWGWEESKEPGGWPSAADMRKAAARKGMPEWQRGTINGMADLVESLGTMMKPLMQNIEQIWKDIKEWLKENRNQIIYMLIILAILALLYALWKLMREARMATWLRTRFDYFSLVLLGMHSGDIRGAQAYYEAMARIFELQDIERGHRNNTQEYLAEINLYYRHLSRETGEMTRIYEDARYGSMADSVQVDHMRGLYRQIFQRIAE